MPIKIVSINIEGDKHLVRILPFLKKVQPDVICFQEMFADDVPLFETELKGSIIFTPLTTMTIAHQTMNAPRGLWGIAVWTRKGVVVKKQIIDYYRGNELDVHEPFNPAVPFSRAVQIVLCMVKKKRFMVANTHFTWTPDGKADDRQREDQMKLLVLLKPYKDLILCGDFNAPRGQEVYRQFAQTYVDQLPEHITTTLDPELHRFKSTNTLAVDSIFTTASYKASSFSVETGLSDHKALIAAFTRTS